MGEKHVRFSLTLLRQTRSQCWFIESKFSDQTTQITQQKRKGMSENVLTTLYS